MSSPDDAVLSFSLPGTPANDNQRRRWHWSRRHREDRTWREAAYYAVLSSPRPAGCPWGLVRVTYQFAYPDARRRDPDNRMASTKPILDGIVAAGVIPDDSDRHVSDIRFLPPVVERGRREVRVTVTRLDTPVVP